MVLVLGLSGYISAGKDTVAKYLVRNYGAIHLKLAEPLQDLTSYFLGLKNNDKFKEPGWKDTYIHTINGVDYTPRQIQKLLGSNLRSVFGDDLFVGMLKDKIDLYPTDTLVVISDIRRPVELDMVYSYSNGYLCYIYNTKAEIAFKNNPEHKHETEAYHPILQNQADFSIEHNSTSDKLYTQVDLLMTSLSSKLRYAGKNDGQ